MDEFYSGQMILSKEKLCQMTLNDFCSIDNSKRTILHQAIISKNIELIKLILEHEFISNIFYITDFRRNNILHLAVSSNSENVLTFILSKLDTDDLKKFITSANTWGDTPVHISSRMSINIFKIMMNNRYTIDVFSKKNYICVCLLNSILICGDLEKIDFMLKLKFPKIYTFTYSFKYVRKDTQNKLKRYIYDSIIIRTKPKVYHIKVDLSRFNRFHGRDIDEYRLPSQSFERVTVMLMSTFLTNDKTFYHPTLDDIMDIMDCI